MKGKHLSGIKQNLINLSVDNLFYDCLIVLSDPVREWGQEDREKKMRLLDVNSSSRCFAGCSSLNLKV
jgi:hypothetical protein